MSENNSLEEKAKKIYIYLKTKEGDMPVTGSKDPALEYLFNNGYLIKKVCCSPQPTPEGDRWAYGK